MENESEKGLNFVHDLKLAVDAKRFLDFEGVRRRYLAMFVVAWS